MDAVGQRPAGFSEAVRHGLVRVRECQSAVGAQTVSKAGHGLMVFASIECLDECEVQRVDAHVEDAHACTTLVRVIRTRTTKTNADLAVWEARLFVQQRINELLRLVYELLHLMVCVPAS